MSKKRLGGRPGIRITDGGHSMDLLRKLSVRAESFARGQTMAEYVLIVSAVAVVVYVGYQSTGSTITTLVTSVNSQM
jgi:Flp pilus assembly pilin Flp